jgi:hypothetical protein
VEPCPTKTTPLPIRASTLKLPERRRFVSPMPRARTHTDSIPSALTIVAGCAALVSLTFAILIYLKH